MSKLQLLKLLSEGLNVLKKDVVKDNYCPLCQQDKNKIQLIKDLTNRIEELKELEKEQRKVNEEGEELSSSLENSVSNISALLKEKLLKEKENTATLKKLQNLKLSFTSYNWGADCAADLHASRTMYIQVFRSTAFIEEKNLVRTYFWPVLYI